MTKYTTVSLPKQLADDIFTLTDKVGYWPSLSSFVREACMEKLQMERSRSKETEP